MSRAVRTGIFSFLFIFLIWLICFPGPFDWSNRIDPWVIGMPFAMFWNLFLSFCIAVLMCVWFFVEDRAGDLDLEIEPIDESKLDSDFNPINQK